MQRIVLACGLMVSIASTACSESSGSGGRQPVDGGSTGGTSGTGGDGGGGLEGGMGGVEGGCSPAAASPLPDSGARSEGCMAQDRALQKLVDASLAQSVSFPPPNALLAVRNPECGTSIYVSGSPTSATATSLWRIASVSKTFTSAAILSLVQDGIVSLDDPLSKWVPGVPNTTGVTVRMLLDHRSGIFDNTEDATFDPTKAWTPQQVVDFATRHAPYFPPDEGFHYSGTNYFLLGMILEAATGQKAGAVLHARAIEPARLSSTLLDGYDSVCASRMARGFGAVGFDNTFLIDPSAAWTAAGVVSDGADLANWVAALYGSDAVLDATRRALLTSKTSNMGCKYQYKVSNWAQYGLGVMLPPRSVTWQAGQGMGHVGSAIGYVTLAFYFPDKKTAIVAIQNSTPADPDRLFLDALNALFPTADQGMTDAGATPPSCDGGS